MACCPGSCGDSSLGKYIGNVSNMQGKYYTGFGAVAQGMVSPGCLESLAAGGAVAYDPLAGGCWGVTGLRIIIGDTIESIQAGFEKVNFNFHVSGTQIPVANQYQLPGPVSMVA